MSRPVTGSVYKESRGTYGIRWSQDGRRPQKGGFRTKTEARAYFADVVRPRLKRGGPSNEITFNEFVDVYLDRWTGAPKTVQDMTKRLAPAKAQFGKYSLRELEGAAHDVAAWQQAIRTDSWRYATTRALRQVLAAGVRWGYMSRNPAVDAGPNPQPRVKEIHPFSREEIAAIVDELSPQYAALVVFASETGLRTNEWVALERRDIDWLNPGVAVQRRFAYGRLTAYPKTSARRVPLTPRAVEALGWIPPRLDTQILFPASKGGHLELNAFSGRVWRPALRAAGVEQRGVYHLRHSFATEALRKGMSIRSLAKLMGNSVLIVERHYGGWSGEDEDHARELLSRPIRQEETG